MPLVPKNTAAPPGEECQECYKVKPSRVWKCAHDESHIICSDCAAQCDRCDRYYCEICRPIALLPCDHCDAWFCEGCKARICVCIVPRVLTCFQLNFKSDPARQTTRQVSGDNLEEHEGPQQKKQRLDEVDGS
mmetsp:Transcript_13204/g.20032  ORF Transcript_13204/g.20032 Transcript_13204/m.20032 type:complete len:133 (+) Transcript_13204:67-465(+)